MKTSIGILGTGRMAVRLALLFLDRGHEVILASRTPDRAHAIAAALDRPNLRAGSYADAVAAPVVLPSIFLRDGLLETLAPYRDQLAGKLWIDLTNPFNATYEEFILPWDTSGAEEIARHFPEVRLVGAFKNVWWEVFDQPAFGDLLSDVYVVSDDEAAKREFLGLVEGSPFRYLDAGRLENARYVERMTLFARELGRRLGYAPRMNWRFLGEPWKAGSMDRVGHLIERAAA